MREYDNLVTQLRLILAKGSYCEDNKLRLKNSIKYDLYNLMLEEDSKFMNELHNRLEYKEEK